MSYQPPQQQPTQDEQIDKFLEELLGGDLPGEGFLFPDPEHAAEPRTTPTVEQVRDELLRAMQNSAIALQLPYSEDKKADLGHALLTAAQAYLLIDPSLDTEGVPVEGPGSKAHAQAAAQAAFPPPAAPGQPQHRVVKTPRAKPNAAEGRLDTRTQALQKDLQGSRGQTPRPRPRIGQ